MFGNKAQMQNMLKKHVKCRKTCRKAGRTEAADRQRLRWRRCYCSHPEWRQTGRFPEDRKDAIDPEDPEMLEDLITTAFNEASKKADEMVQKGMSEVTGGLGLPGGMF